ncbi:APC amino acid permease [Russula earlei]|uniref:APC amino acid permease n=1 Tax=Russula earlei TaxID=71964 RepID=A0ACC0TXX9_9AGAM|nr:APC amino acid permease [Russula earlei]
MSDWNSVTKASDAAEVGGLHMSDEAELAGMGYKQELKRDLSLSQNFGVSFSIISVITGGTCLLPFGLTTGGPAVMVWGWVIVAFFTMLVGLAMAEICSAYPTSGGPSYWAAIISKPKGARLASWVTGWFSVLGQVAVTTGVSIPCAEFISTTATICTNYQPSTHKTIGIFAAILFAQGTINTFGIHVLKYLSIISVWWNSLGTISLLIAILTAAPKHQSGKFVFRTFIDGTGVDGVGWSQRSSPVYVAVIGILMAQWTMTGFDASAHMAEETRNAALIGPIGILTTFSITSNSRMMYAFSRDATIPTSEFFHKVDRRWHSPIRTVWLSCTLSFILGFLSLGSPVALNAATSIATIGAYTSYGVPIALRVVHSDRFVRGPFHLGRFSHPVAIAAVLWIGFILIVFCLPEVNPVNLQTFNYAPVAAGLVLTFALLFWAVSARKWFTGPIKDIADDQMIVDVVEAMAVSGIHNYSQ